MEEVEELRESTSAEKYKDASIDELARHYLELGDLYFKTRRYVRAITAYEKAVELVPGDGSLHLVLADALFADGRFARAAYELRQAFDLHPELAQANVDKREFYGHPDDFAKHMDALVKDIDEKPFDSNARLVYVVNLLLSGGLEEAERQIEILATHLRGRRHHPAPYRGHCEGDRARRRRGSSLELAKGGPLTIAAAQASAAAA
jgi:tetratricopeptide (TPR) repeat protein